MTDLDLQTTIESFPREFGLRNFPGKRMRISHSDSYLTEGGKIVLYTEAWNSGLRRWEAFAKGSVTELRRELVPLDESDVHTSDLESFTLSISLGNDAMQTKEDVGRALQRVANVLETYASTMGKVRDENGNTVGEWFFGRTR